ASAAVKPAVPAPMTQSSCRSSPIQPTIRVRNSGPSAAADRTSEDVPGGTKRLKSNRCSIVLLPKRRRPMDARRRFRPEDQGPKPPSLHEVQRAIERLDREDRAMLRPP